MVQRTAEEKLRAAADWWSTGITEIKPGQIRMRGYAIEDLIGQVSFVQMIWLLLQGDLPSADQAALLEAALVAGVDHGPHAPSIAIARMAATCGVPLNGAVASAVNVLDDVHGGAGQQCMELLGLIHRKIGAGQTLEGAVDDGLAEFVSENGKIVPGFGHRFHPVDPRAAPLFAMVAAAAASGAVKGDHVAICRRIQSVLGERRGKAMPINIDGSTAVVYSELGLAPELGRGLFVMSRGVGILAHAWEQMQQGERIKGPMPKDIDFTYTGPGPRPLARP